MAPVALRRLWRLQLAVLLAVMLCGPATAAPLGTALTYQGSLESGGAPADGVFDLRFTVWDAEAGGSDLGTVTVDDLVVSGGVVSTELDFGDVYDGTALWLEVEVRDSAIGGAYTVITPRQPLRPLPLALYARAAGHAVLADDATAAGDVKEIDGVNAAGLLAFTGLTGIPADLADGDADLLAGLGCAAGEVVVWQSGAWTCGPDRGGWRTLVVGPVGDAATNGAALLAAAAALPTPASSDDGWRLRLEPGRYDLGSASLVMKPWTVLTGAGESATVVTSSVCNPASGEEGTVVAAANTRISHLTVENTCASGSDSGVAVRVPDAATGSAVEHVTARTTGSAMYAAGLISTAQSMWLHQITASAAGGSSVNVGMTCGESAIVSDSTATASGGDLAVGLAVGSTSELAPTSVIVTRGTFTASAATVTSGLQVSSADADLELVTLSGAEGLTIISSFGYNNVHASRLTSTGPVTVTRTGGDLDVTISQSRVVATGAAVTAAGLPVDIRVAATQLWGGAPSTAATCAGVWDETWVFYPSTCP